MTSPVIHFLLIFDHRAGELLEARDFTDGTEAVQAYGDAEAEHRGNDLIEIVLVASDSFETIQITHANYFASFSPVSRFLDDIAV